MTFETLQDSSAFQVLHFTCSWCLQQWSVQCNFERIANHVLTIVQMIFGQRLDIGQLHHVVFHEAKAFGSD
jgi:hypothetical protein